MQKWDRVRVDDPGILNGCEAVILDGPFEDGKAHVAVAFMFGGNARIARETVGVTPWYSTEQENHG